MARQVWRGGGFLVVAAAPSDTEIGAMLKRLKHWIDRRALRRRHRQAVKAPAEYWPPELDLLMEMLRRFEGFRSNAYQCQGGKWTYGYGSTRRPDGTRVQPGDNIREAAARRLLAEEAEAVLKEARELTDGHSPSIGCLAAIASLIYNVGPEPVARSRFLAAWKRGDMTKARYEFVDFNKVGATPVRGLTLRREAEWETLITGEIT